MPKMNNHSTSGKDPSIGDIGRTKAETTLFFDTDSVPAKIVDGSHNLICWYAKQVMEDQSIKACTSTKLKIAKGVDENKAANRRNNTQPSEDISTSKTRDYWYFFSPLYFGESPVACITSPEWQNGIAKVVSIYTFKRMNDRQQVANIDGYFGGEL